MALSRRSLAQWRHAGHNRRAGGARWRGDPRRLRRVRRHRRRLGGLLAPDRAHVVPGARRGRVPAPAGEPDGLVAGRRRRRVRLRRGARGRVPADGREPLGGYRLGDRGDRAAGALARRGRPGGRRRPVRLVPVRAARTRLRTRRHLDGGAGGFPAPAARGGQRGQHRAGRRTPGQRATGLVPRLVGACPGAAGRSRRGGVPHLPGLAGDRGGAARAALPAHRRGPAQEDTLAVPGPGGLVQPVDPGRPALAAGRPGQRGRRGRQQRAVLPGARRHPGVAAGGVVLHRGVRYRPAGPARVRAPCPAGCRSPSCSPCWPSWPACWPAGSRRPPSRWRSPWPPGRRARPSGAVWSTPRTAGCSARGWRATPTSAASARA